MSNAGFRDPTEQSAWRPLRLLQAAMDAEITRVYTEARIDQLKPTWVLELLRLHAKGPMTITELASSVQLTHSAVSQKVAAMRTAGWIRTAAGPDARSKEVHLTGKATRIIDLLAAEWRATEAAVAELEAEIPYPLSRVVTDIEEALRRRSFHDRILEKLAQDPDWTRSQAEPRLSSHADIEHGVTAERGGATARRKSGPRSRLPRAGE